VDGAREIEINYAPLRAKMNVTEAREYPGCSPTFRNDPVDMDPVAQGNSAM
jgi:hypothetical protein